MNKLTKTLMAGVALLAATCVFAIPKGPCDTKKDICCEDIKPGPFAFSYARDLGLACPRDFYIHADYLLMTAHQGGMEFALLDTNTWAYNISPGEVCGFGNSDKRWDWHSGVKVGLGFFLNHDAWNIDAEWMWLHIKENCSYSTTGNDYYVPLMGGGAWQSDPNTAKQASAKWKCEYNTVDFKLAHPYHISRYLVASPHFGLRMAWLDQNLLFRYSGTYTYPTIDGLRVKGTNDFWGVGTRAGFDSEWLLGSGVSLFGKVAAALLYGKFDTNETDNLSTDDAYHLETSHKFYRIIPNMNINVGLSWGKFFSKRKYLVSAKIGYEFHYWWNMNQWAKFYDDDPNAYNKVAGDLALGGLDFGLQVDF